MKSQDVLLLCLLIANKESRNYKQAELAKLLCMSSSTINESLERLESVMLISSHIKDVKYFPAKYQCTELITKGMYAFLPKDMFHPKIDLFLNNKLHSYESIRSINHMWSLIHLAWISPKPLHMSIVSNVIKAIDIYC